MGTLPPGLEDTSAVGMHPTGMPSCYDIFSTYKYSPKCKQMFLFRYASRLCPRGDRCCLFKSLFKCSTEQCSEWVLHL